MMGSALTMKCADNNATEEQLRHTKPGGERSLQAPRPALVERKFLLAKDGPKTLALTR
jgi:hypothetical protein